MGDRAMPQVGDLVAKYRIEEVIGEGGMGAVFAATHTLTGKRVAIKWMLPSLAADQAAVQRFMREAQAAGRIDHPNIVNVHDVSEHNGSHYLVMEYLHGETLSAALLRGGLDAQQVIALLLPAMRGVAAAHATGVVHRDLKPDNIFLCRGTDGSYREPKVLDFGISKVASSEGQLNPRLTRTGAVMGTPYYMSPEQVRSAEIDQRADVYAFGVILYEALTGSVPFDADAYSALVLAIATGTPKRPRELRPDLPPALEGVVLKAMAREPPDRFQDVESLARALEPFAQGLTFRVDRPDQTQRRRMDTGTTPFASVAPALPLKRGQLGVAIGALALFLLGVGIWMGLRPAAEPSQANVVRPAPSVSTAAPATSAAAQLPAAPPIAAAQLDAGVSAQNRPAGKALPMAETPVSTPVRTAPAPRTKPTPSTKPSSGRTGGLNSDEF